MDPSTVHFAINYDLASSRPVSQWIHACGQLQGDKSIQPARQARRHAAARYTGSPAPQAANISFPRWMMQTKEVVVVYTRKKLDKQRAFTTKEESPLRGVRGTNERPSRTRLAQNRRQRAEPADRDQTTGQLPPSPANERTVEGTNDRTNGRTNNQREIGSFACKEKRIQADRQTMAAEPYATGTGPGSRRRERAATWTDAELEELYDVNALRPENAMKMRHLLQVMKVIRRCNKASTLDAAIAVTVENTCKIMNCDRATLFIVDERREELVLRQAVGVKDIRLPLDESSIAGAVYLSGEKLNIPDAYDSPYFNKSTDQATGYKTTSILCTPIRDANFEPVAVLQAVNKLSDAPDGDSDSQAAEGSSNTGEQNLGFTKLDEVLMDHLSLQLGIILRNQMLREASEIRHRQVLSMVDIVRSLHSKMGINSLIFTVTERSPSLVDAERCTLYVVDRKHNELMSIQGAVEIRTTCDKGLAGYTATTGEIINIEDAHKDPRFNTEFDLKSGFKTKSVLVMPITDRQVAEDREAEVIGVLQLINKVHGHRFTEEDEHLLSSFLDIVGGHMSSSQLFASSHQPTTTEFGAAQDIAGTGSVSPMPPLTRRHGSSGNVLYQPDSIDEIQEEDEDEEDDSGMPLGVPMT